MTFPFADSSHYFEDLLKSLEEKGIDPGVLSESLREKLRTLAVYSPRLAGICSSKPDILIPLLDEEIFHTAYSKKELQELLQSRMRNSDNPELSLRRFHRTQIVRIALRDLCNLADIRQITEELSDLADTIVEGVFEFIWTALVGQYGEPWSDDRSAPSRMTVISLGKHGGRELNFSSDIDLMFVYNHKGQTSGDGKKIVSNESFFTLLAQGICDLLGKTTSEGFLYRIDNRLRPEGDKGALAVSLLAVEMYYHTYGQNWERQMLLKARPIAGDSSVGRQFIQLIAPFTYRKYVDEVEIAEVLRGIDVMREKSLAKLGSLENQINDFKNGYGGIRDIEFFVQAVQMLYGGQYPEIKLAGTLLSLQRMNESHLLHSNDYKTLANAYRFLRRIEHRLQMVADQQVYELPRDNEGRARLALSMGFTGWDLFFEQYDTITHNVRSIYSGVFQREEWQVNLDFLIDEESYSEELGDLLEFYEFAEPKRAYAFIKDLNKSPDLHLQPKTTRLFKEILPRLLLCLKNSPDPDLALANFEKLVSSFRARTSLYESLSAQPRLIEMLASVTGSSSFLTRLVLRDPSLMESIEHDEFLEESVTVSRLESHLKLIKQTYPKASLRDCLLRVQNAAMFHSGIRFILGLEDVERMGANLAQIADFVLDECLEPVSQRAAQRFSDLSTPLANDAAILGFGKLGGREFNVASDCDLVFVYTESREVGNVTSVEYFQHWTKYLLQYLEEKTPLGFLYHADIRLRPHGKKGAEALTQETLLDYYRKQAQFWEKMALTRARFICGNPEIKGFLERLKEEVLFSAPPSREETLSILDMRQRIEKEKKEETLKAGPGGLVDVEFIAQAISLHFGYKEPALRSTSTFEILRAASVCGVLPALDASQLIASYTFLRDVENRLRIVDNASLDSLPTGEEELKKLTRRYAQHLESKKITKDEFLAQIEDHTRKVREIFDRFFEGILE